MADVLDQIKSVTNGIISFKLLGTDKPERAWRICPNMHQDRQALVTLGIPRYSTWLEFENKIQKPLFYLGFTVELIEKEKCEKINSVSI